MIITTTAFGIAIDKKDVRFVIHYSIPKSIECYFLDCGKSGENQLPAECILYYDYNDRKTIDFSTLMNSALNGV